MTVLIGRHDACGMHLAGHHHPEAPERLAAVLGGVRASEAADDLVEFEPRRATAEELSAVHDPRYVRALEALCADGGGRLDADTSTVAASFEAALRAAGAGLDAAARLEAGEADSAFLAVRPPGHHALSKRAMGFCLFNNVAVTANALASKGARVAIVDWDAHHGNGTQDIFYERADVLYVSLHQYPWYPGTGSLHETGEGAGLGMTLNLPMPAGTGGDVYRAAFDEVVGPVVARFAPDWVLVSAGFDAHRDDPLCELLLTSGDYADLTAACLALAPAGRAIAFLEGGYDLDALTNSSAACVSALAGIRQRPEAVSGPGPAVDGARAVIQAARTIHLEDS
jgi:acetoin utilization deacetylase AcuC-like enzyme